MQEFEEIWDFVLSELKNLYSETVIKVWLRDSKIEAVTDSSAVIYIQSAFKKEIVKKNYSAAISEALEKIFGYKIDVFFRSEGEPDPLSEQNSLTSEAPGTDHTAGAADNSAASATTGATGGTAWGANNGAATGGAAWGANNGAAWGERPAANGTATAGASGSGSVHNDTAPLTAENESVSAGPSDEKLFSAGIEEDNEPDFYTVGDNQSTASVIDSNEYTFDNFIVGSSNKFAHAACVSVAQNPAHSYNPLFIYGPSGLGKTHLLYAITHEIHKNHPDYNIIYVKGEEFTNQMIESISKNLTSEFRERYRKADVLLIDDIHFIAGKDSTQEEFFHTFNDLYEHKKQIILTSDRPAKDIQKLEERLRTRFEWGLSADIQPPDFELRVAIMRKKAEALGKPFSSEVLNFLAEKLTNNIRQMEGAIKKIIAYSCLNSEEVTISLVTSCISDLLTDNGNLKITAQKIISTVAEKYNVSENDIYSNKRTSNIAKARHICIYLIKKLMDLSYPAIGRILKRDHTTMLHSYETIANEIKINSVFEIEINEMIKEFRN